jgi:hypothetical protein
LTQGDISNCKVSGCKSHTPYLTDSSLSIGVATHQLFTKLFDAIAEIQQCFT